MIESASFFVDGYQSSHMHYPTHRITQRRIRHYIAKKKKCGVNTKEKKEHKRGIISCDDICTQENKKNNADANEGGGKTKYVSNRCRSYYFACCMMH